MPKILNHDPNGLVVLAATKLDLRLCAFEDHLKYLDGISLQQTLGANAFVECSALEKINITALFESVILCIDDRNEKCRQKRGTCEMM